MLQYMVKGETARRIPSPHLGNGKMDRRMALPRNMLFQRLRHARKVGRRVFWRAMSKKFYREVKLIKFCKNKKCGVEYRPQRGSFFAMLGLCWECRRPYYAMWYKEIWKPWFANQTPKKQAEIKNQKYLAWKAWVTDNIVKRRKQALASYHRNKKKKSNKERKHRSTKKRG